MEKSGVMREDVYMKKPGAMCENMYTEKLGAMREDSAYGKTCGGTYEKARHNTGEAMI